MLVDPSNRNQTHASKAFGAAEPGLTMQTPIRSSTNCPPGPLNFAVDLEDAARWPGGFVTLCGVSFASKANCPPRMLGRRGRELVVD